MINIIPNSQIRKINYYWQDVLDYKPQDKISSSQVIPESCLKGSNKIMIFHINKISFLKTDPLLFDDVSNFISTHYSYKTVNGDCFIKNFKGTICKNDTIYFYYLAENNLMHDTLDSNYLLRLLTPSDVSSLNNLKKLCSKAELKMSNIDLTQPVVLGCFYKNNLICVSSLEFLQNDIANIKVLIHPEFEKNGIGKLTLKAICQYGLSQNKIIQYKFSETDTYSKMIAETLGFKLYVIQENLEVGGQSTEYKVQ
ncbi:hypothetical protein [Clostridium hydrogenum]|uniref:hypothetical protein n=1 Tax=Clostridium hydrogenum TaxID=2855764 RepID=UPI001F26B255|nr:hypothetical protein [Clostridium hydrogenum]